MKINNKESKEIHNQANLIALNIEMQWLYLAIEKAILNYFKCDKVDTNVQKKIAHTRYYQKNNNSEEIIGLPIPPVLHNSSYAFFLAERNLTVCERFALALSMATAIQPNIFDVFFNNNQATSKPYAEFGGVEKNGNLFVPTGQTLNFIISACLNDPDTPQLNLDAINILSPQHPLILEKIIELKSVDEVLSNLSCILKISDNWLAYFTTGIYDPIEYSHNFPAKRIYSELEWQDLVLNQSTLKQVIDMKTWLRYSAELLISWQLTSKIKKGYRAIFYGASGTGKTLTATLLAKDLEVELYRVDLSMMVSKYIGETEKNLAKVFDLAEHKNWILFFDEADALFGARSTANTANDRNANQLTGYLLQRIEDFTGTVILATNLKTNMDSAFTRRFQSIIEFNLPGPDERKKLWENAFSGQLKLAEDVDFKKIANNFELTGAQIINILRQCALIIIQRKVDVNSETDMNVTRVSNGDILMAIRVELSKENIIV